MARLLALVISRLVVAILSLFRRARPEGDDAEDDATAGRA